MVLRGFIPISLFIKDQIGGLQDIILIFNTMKSEDRVLESLNKLYFRAFDICLEQ